MHVIWPWIQTRLIGVWSCLMETLWPHFSRRLSRTPTSLSASTAGRRCSVSSPSPPTATIGRWSGGGVAPLWVWSVGPCPAKGRIQGRGLGITANRGAWSCQTCVAQPCTPIRRWRSLWPTALESGCFWTGPQGLWLSIVWMTSWFLSMLFKGHSHHRCTLRSGWAVGSAWGWILPWGSSAPRQTALKSVPCELSESHKNNIQVLFHPKIKR